MAADGLRSAARPGSGPRTRARLRGVHGLARRDGRAVRTDGGAETWGRGAEFGATIMLDGRSTGSRPRTARGRAGARRARRGAAPLRRWHDPIARIVRATAPAAVLRHDIYSLALPLPPMHRGRVALLGDAAHAMTPNLGQARVRRSRTRDAGRAVARERRPRRPRPLRRAAPSAHRPAGQGLDTRRPGDTGRQPGRGTAPRRRGACGAGSSRRTRGPADDRVGATG